MLALVKLNRGLIVVLILLYHAEISFCQNYSFSTLVSCANEHKDLVEQIYKNLEELKKANSNKCYNEVKKNFCHSGIVVENDFKYKGPYYKNSNVNNALFHNKYDDPFPAIILFSNGIFFSGQFIKKISSPTEPTNGFLYIDRETYYIGDVQGSLTEGKIKPHGTGKKYRNGCNGAEIIEGIWNNGVPSQTNIYRITSITIRDPLYCNEKKEVVTFLDESIKNKRKIVSELDENIAQKTNSLNVINNEVSAAKYELKLMGQDDRNEDIKKIKELLRNYTSVANVLGNTNFRPSLYEFQDIFYSQDAQMNNRYDGKLKTHLESFRFENYNISNYFIRVMTIQSLYSLWNSSSFRPRFHDHALTKNIFMVSFINSLNGQTYNVIFYKNNSNNFKIIQLFLI
jgi:hypothetical protein